MSGLRKKKIAGVIKQGFTIFKMQEILDFIRNIYNSQELIPLHEPRFTGNEKKYLADCIDSTFVSSVGKYVDRFEEQVAEFTGAKHAIAVVNGTQALFVALQLAGVKPQAEVITQSLSFVATANAIRHVGAWPVFLDVDADTMGLSPQALRTFLESKTEVKAGQCINRSSGRKIAAIVPMHTLGHACRIEQIQAIAAEFKIPLVEDAAESLGTTVAGQHTGTFGLLGSLSFNGNKVITTGGGGIILTNDSDLASKAKHLTTTAKVPHPYEFIHDEVGYNFRLPNLNAAVGVAQMEQLPRLLAGQRSLTAKYKEFFDGRDDVDLAVGLDGNGSVSNFWINALIWKEAQDRRRFLEISNQNKIMTRAFWKPLHSLAMFSASEHDDLKHTKSLYQRAVHISSTALI